jgi:hypothetical protein
MLAEPGGASPSDIEGSNGHRVSHLEPENAYLIGINQRWESSTRFATIQTHGLGLAALQRQRSDKQFEASGSKKIVFEICRRHRQLV